VTQKLELNVNLWCKFLNSYAKWPLAKNFQVAIVIRTIPHNSQMFIENRRHPFEDSVPTDELTTIVISRKHASIERIIGIVSIVNQAML